MNEFVSKINSSNYKIEVLSDKEVKVNNENYFYSFERVSKNKFVLNFNDKNYTAIFLKNSPDQLSVLINNNEYQLKVITLIQEEALTIIEKSSSSLEKTIKVKAPMPGLILKIKKQDGEVIRQGDSILILEAMKMENEIKAPSTGIIKFASITEGKNVEKGTLLFSIE